MTLVDQWGKFDLFVCFVGNTMLCQDRINGFFVCFLLFFFPINLHAGFFDEIKKLEKAAKETKNEFSELADSLSKEKDDAPIVNEADVVPTAPKETQRASVESKSENVSPQPVKKADTPSTNTNATQSRHKDRVVVKALEIPHPDTFLPLYLPTYKNKLIWSGDATTGALTGLTVTFYGNLRDQGLKVNEHYSSWDAYFSIRQFKSWLPHVEPEGIKEWFTLSDNERNQDSQKRYQFAAASLNIMATYVLKRDTCTKYSPVSDHSPRMSLCRGIFEKREQSEFDLRRNLNEFFDKEYPKLVALAKSIDFEDEIYHAAQLHPGYQKPDYDFSRKGYYVLYGIDHIKFERRFDYSKFAKDDPFKKVNFEDKRGYMFLPLNMEKAEQVESAISENATMMIQVKPYMMQLDPAAQVKALARGEHGYAFNLVSNSLVLSSWKTALEKPPYAVVQELVKYSID